MRIGILLTKKHQELKKEEVINVNDKRRPWLKYAPEHLTVNSKGKTVIPDDAAIGMYLETQFKNVIVDYILPKDLTPKRLKQNDLNFMIIYDLLESYHNEPRNVFLKLKNTLKKANNIFPSYEYQQYINNKCLYYEDLDKKNITVAPTLCRYDKNADKLLKDVKEQKWEQIIAKPVYGQESKLFKKFKDLSPKPIKNHMTKIVDKYGLPGTIFQEYIKGFDKSNIEVRSFYVGNNYNYSVYTSSDNTWTPKEEGGTKKYDRYKNALDLSKKTLKKLPKMCVNGVNLPRLLTRIDIGCCLEGKQQDFVNEVEFVPSLYIEMKNLPTLIDVELAKQMHKITKLYISKLSRKSVSKVPKKSKKMKCVSSKIKRSTKKFKRGPPKIIKKRKSK